MPAVALSCRDLSTRTRIRCLPARARVSLRSVREGATYQEIAARGGGIQSTVRATREATLDELVSAGKRYADWFLRTGTTTVEAKSGYGLTLEDELKILRAIKRLDSRNRAALRSDLPRRSRHSA